jgi:hypothetical protein
MSIASRAPGVGSTRICVSLRPHQSGAGLDGGLVHRARHAAALLDVRDQTGEFGGEGGLGARRQG